MFVSRKGIELMDDNKNVVVDFVFPSEYEPSPERKPAAGVPKLGKCTGCGGQKYHLASELRREGGIPASRMFECADCGTYRLG